jgi:hypothetical protein
MLYKDIIIKNDDEEFRLIRLKKLVDEIYSLVPIDYIVMIKKLVDIKGELNVYWIEPPSNFYKMIIDSMWMKLYEYNVKHIIINPEDICKCCDAPVNKEDPEIKEYLNSYNLNYII